MEDKNKKINKEWLMVLGSVVLSLLAVVVISFVLLVVKNSLESRVIFKFSEGPTWHHVFGIQTAQAAPLKGYEAMPVSSTSQLTLSPGESKKVSIGFQNIGTAVWTNDGSNFISIYTYDPKYRSSVFFDSSWPAKDQPAKLLEPKIEVKEVGHITFTLKAPTKIGTYKETFAMAAEDKAWIPGGQFTITIIVNSPSPSGGGAGGEGAHGDGLGVRAKGYSATLLVKSVKKIIKVKGGEIIAFTAGLKNTGSKTWTSRSIKIPSVSLASAVSYKDSSWVNSTTAVIKNDGTVVPGALDLIAFKFKAPTKKGTYTVKFALSADGIDSIPGSEIEIPVEVTSDAPEAKESAKTLPTEVDEDENYINEPTLRVGVLIVDEETDDKVEITCASDFFVKDGNGNLLAEMKKNEEIEAFYKKGKYWFNRGLGLEATSYYLRFIPEEDNTVCAVTNLDRRETRNAAYADNQFRNILELRYNEFKDRVWLINELPMEYYLRGLAETSNNSNLEFQKALITAARTYAMYHFERATKHAAEYFHVDAYADQVYNGYGQEARTPRLTQAVQETAGQIVTYENKTAITPYFSRSDGRTRSWSEVWGGDVAWCLTVKTPHDSGKKLWGHGVGMSASEALAMGNEGEEWEEILKYFYTGVEIEKKWK